MVVDPPDGLRQLEAVLVVDAVHRWVDQLDQGDSRFEHHRLEALWLTAALRKPSDALLKQTGRSSNHHVRAATMRFAANNSSRVDALARLEAGAEDDPSRHVIAGSIVSPGSTVDVAEIALGWAERLR